MPLFSEKSKQPPEIDSHIELPDKALSSLIVFPYLTNIDITSTLNETSNHFTITTAVYNVTNPTHNQISNSITFLSSKILTQF